MPSIDYGTSSYEQARGNLPSLPVVNMFAEEAPTETKGVMLQSRPGLADRSADMGAGPVRQLFQRNGVLGGTLYGVSGSGLYSGASLVGAIDGTGPVSIAGYSNYLFTASGGALWSYNGAVLSPIAFPDSATVIKVLVGGSRAIALRSDTQQYYYSDPLETDIEALDFISAESQPDELLDALFVDDTLILFGAETVEFHPNTYDAELPFRPLESSTFSKGIKATGCAVEIGSTFAWVTNQNQVCLSDENNIISNPGLEERIEGSSSVSMFKFLIGGIEFLALRIDDETQIWSVRSRLWSEFSSIGLDNWRAQCAEGTIFGSSVDGKTLTWGAHADLGEDMERRFAAGIPINSAGLTINNIGLRLNPGQTPFLTGDYADPSVEMRVSRDAGQTWGNWKPTSLGTQGEYRQKVQWRAIGMASQPAFLAEFRVTDPAPFRVSDVFVNEPWGGR